MATDIKVSVYDAIRAIEDLDNQIQDEGIGEVFEDERRELVDVLRALLQTIADAR